MPLYLGLHLELELLRAKEMELLKLLPLLLDILHKMLHMMLLVMDMLLLLLVLDMMLVVLMGIDLDLL